MSKASPKITLPEIKVESKAWLQSWVEAWNTFWFSPRDSNTLGLIRIFVGLIVLYTHLVWTFELSTFLGDQAVLPNSYRTLLFEGSPFAWSHFDWFGTSISVHVIALIIMAMFMIGMFARVTSVLTALLVISYANRATGVQFGLDQINCFLCLYLAIGNSGGAFSFDRWLAERDARDARAVRDDRKKSARTEQGRGADGGSVLTNIAIRLIQVHLCIVYLFAGLGKLQGSTWWNGEAIWGALASYEYQTIDMTWLAHHLWLVNLMTLIALVWEVGYAILIWNRLTRPIMLAIAIPVHLGIGMCMGMMEFGLIMLVANLAFVSFVAKGEEK